MKAVGTPGAGEREGEMVNFGKMDGVWKLEMKPIGRDREGNG